MVAGWNEWMQTLLKFMFCTLLCDISTEKITYESEVVTWNGESSDFLSGLNMYYVWWWRWVNFRLFPFPAKDHEYIVHGVVGFRVEFQLGGW